MNTIETELFYVASHTILGSLVNKEQVIAMSQAENMQPLTTNELQNHLLGIYLAEGLGKGAPAVGYIALKSFEYKSSDHEPTLLGGVIGSLCLTEKYRGKGYAEELVTYMISRSFEVFPSLDYLTANCNSRSLARFYTNGFAPEGSPQPRQCVVLNRSDWGGQVLE